MTCNSLGVGSRVIHINPQIDPSCSFCRKKNILPAPVETFEHLFVNYPITNLNVIRFFKENVAEAFTAMSCTFMVLSKITQ